MKKLLSFEFWQKFGKCLMVVIAVMPAAGLMVSIGNSLPLISDAEWLARVGNIIAQIGWGIIGNLHLLFALAIGGSWANERAGGAFAAGLAFILINLITGHFFGVKIEMLADPNAHVSTILAGDIPVANYFVNILGQPALNMGVFVGIIAGFVGATTFNSYYNFRKLPEVLTFFNGKRFVPFVVIYRSVLVALILAVFWPVVQTGINHFGEWIANSQDSAPILAPFVYGTLERLLLPFGLHHMLTIPMNYTSLGGTYEFLTGMQQGKQVFGQDPLWLAWISDLINLKDAGNMTQYNELLSTVTPARFKVGQMIGSSGILMGITLAMYVNVDTDKKTIYKGIFLSSALAVCGTRHASTDMCDDEVEVFVTFAVLLSITAGYGFLVQTVKRRYAREHRMSAHTCNLLHFVGYHRVGYYDAGIEGFGEFDTDQRSERAGMFAVLSRDKVFYHLVVYLVCSCLDRFEHSTATNDDIELGIDIILRYKFYYNIFAEILLRGYRRKRCKFLGSVT